VKSREGRDHQVISVAEVQLLPWGLSGNFLRAFVGAAGRTGAAATCGNTRSLQKAERRPGRGQTPQPRIYLTRHCSSCEKCSPITQPTARSNPNRGPESEADCFARDDTSPSEMRGRRTTGAAGRWLNTAGCSKRNAVRKAASALAMTALVPKL